MKLEVGMYVRHHHFGIGKIINSYESDKIWFNVKFNCYGDDDYHCGICEESIGFKASHNIIDLIEVGDYVNGCKVLIVNIDNEKDVWTTILDNGKILVSDSVKSILPIKSIVTKEQFETISYKVK